MNASKYRLANTWINAPSAHLSSDFSVWSAFVLNQERGSYKTERVKGDLQLNRFYYNDMTYLKLHCSDTVA